MLLSLLGGDTAYSKNININVRGMLLLTCIKTRCEFNLDVYGFNVLLFPLVKTIGRHFGFQCHSSSKKFCLEAAIK